MATFKIIYLNIFIPFFWNDIKNGLLCHCPKSNGPFPSYATQTVGETTPKRSPHFYDNRAFFILRSFDFHLFFCINMKNKYSVAITKICLVENVLKEN